MPNPAEMTTLELVRAVRRNQGPEGWLEAVDVELAERLEKAAVSA